MPWCPKCGSEYREGFDYCSECNVKLVESLEAGTQEPKDEIHEEYLTTASDEEEAGMLEALLQSNDIPVLRKYRGAGEYVKLYMGNSAFGIDIYVPSNLKKKSKEIIDSRFDVQNVDDDYDENFKLDDEEGKKRRVKVWIILLIFIIPGIISLLISFFKGLFALFS